MTAPAPPPMSPDLRARVIASARAGEGPEGALRPLMEAGWDRDAAIAAIEPLLREFVAALARERGMPEPRRVPSPAVPNGATMLHLPDREIAVLAQMRHPRVIVLGGVLDGSECEGLIELARATLTQSRVVDPLTGEHALHESRSSEGATIPRGANPLVRRIESRLAALCDWPLPRTEELHVLHYGPGAEFRPHHDYFDPREAGSAPHLAQGGQRVASLVMYLNTPPEGGATVFPDAGFEVAAVRGNAVFFSYDMPHPMTRTLHGGAVVRRGEKWIATLWLREITAD